MPFARALAKGSAAAALCLLVLVACGREAPLEERVLKRLEAKDVDGALGLLDQRLQKAPEDEGAKVLRVRVLLAGGRIDEAMAAFGRLSEKGLLEQPRLARQFALTLVAEAFRSGNAFLESRAAMALAAVGDAEALPLIRAALTHKNPAVRALTLRGLRRVRAPEAAGLAAKALEDEDGGVRAVAAELLGDLRAAEARDGLRRALGDKEGIVALRAAVALALLGEAEGKDVLRRTIAAPLKVEGRGTFEQIVAAEGLARLGEPAGRELLVRLLQHPRQSAGLFAAEALSNLNDPAPRDFLRKVVQEGKDRNHRMWASWTLARFEDDAGRPAALELLADKEEPARLEAAWTLGQMGRLAPVGPLQKALADQSLFVRYQAVWSISEIVLAPVPLPKPKAG